MAVGVRLVCAHLLRTSPKQDPKGPATGKLRVLHSGYWGNPSAMLRTTRRIALAPNAKGPGFGVRLVQMAP